MDGIKPHQQVEHKAIVTICFESSSRLFFIHLSQIKAGNTSTTMPFHDLHDLPEFKEWLVKTLEPM